MYTSGAKQYQNINKTSEALDADPHRLIQLLMEASLTRMAAAKVAIENDEMDTKANLLGRVWEIIHTLQGSLDHSQPGEVSNNLERVYDYMSRRLLDASAANDVSMIDEVMALMANVKHGWDGIREEYLASMHGQPSTNESEGSTVTV